MHLCRSRVVSSDLMGAENYEALESPDFKIGFMKEETSELGLRGLEERLLQ